MRPYWIEQRVRTWSLLTGLVLCLLPVTLVADPSGGRDVLDLHQLADKGEPGAQARLGDYYYALEEYREAVTWYVKAARQGHTEAQISLSFCYARGHGVKRDSKKAKAWSRMALMQARQKPFPTPTRTVAKIQPVRDIPAKPQEEPDPIKPLPKPETKSGIQRISILQKPSPQLETSPLKPAGYINLP